MRLILCDWVCQARGAIEVHIHTHTHIFTDSMAKALIKARNSMCAFFRCCVFACVTEFLSTRKHTEAAAIHAVSLALAKRIVSSALSPLPHYIGRESYYWEVCHHFRMLSQKADAINQPIYNMTSRRGTGKVLQPHIPTTHSYPFLRLARGPSTYIPAAS
jgi:hypothetical protein